MRLYLARHAEAEAGEQMDPTRALTDLGKRQAKMMGKWLKRQTEGPDIVVESNMRRSIQTAKRLAKRLDVDRVRTSAIDPDGDPEKAYRTLKSIARDHGAKSVIAVSHGPLVQGLHGYLVGTDPAKLNYAHGSISHFDDQGKLHWLVSPNTVARDEDEAENVTRDAVAVAEASLKVLEALELFG
jgi:phosphohistidine phosphatase